MSGNEREETQIHGVESNMIEDSQLTKFLSGNASPEEAMMVNDWISASDDNKLHYQELEKVWTLGKFNVHITKGYHTSWVDLKEQMKRGRVHHNHLTYRIAASIVIVIGVAIVAYLYRPSFTGKSDAWNSKQTSNEIASLNLPDGSAVTVNRNSSIQWPEQTTDTIREVRLKGEAFFDVTHHPEMPFVVSTDEIRIKVLGTIFNVMNSSSGNVETAVIRGKVMMYNSQSRIIIQAGMKGVYNKITKELSLEKLSNENSVAYATHILSFKSISLKEVCAHLSKTYGVQFTFENKRVEHCTLTSAYSNKSLSFIMDVISESLGITYRIEGNSVYISGDGCL